jgi:hypothetical protein
MRLPYKYKTPEGEIKPFSLPSSWEDVTLKEMMLALKLSDSEHKEDPAHWIALFSGLDVATVNRFQTGFVLSELWPVVGFVFTEAPNFQEVANERPPLVITLAGKEYSTAFEPSKLQFGYQIRYENICKGGKIAQDNIAECVALCLCETPYSESDTRLKELIEAVENMPYTDAFRLHSFFLGKFLSSAEAKKPKAHSPNLTRLQRALTGSKNMAGYLRSIASRLGIRPKTATT